MAETDEDLVLKLNGYRDQLRQVEDALLEAPGEEALLKLKQDLSEVIALTEDLVRYKEPVAEEPAPAPEPVAAARGPQGLVGRTCEVIYDNQWFNAEIIQIRRDERGVERVGCKILGLGTVKEYKGNELKLLKPPHAAQLQPGTKIQAIWPSDGLWYEATLTEQTEKGWLVTWTAEGSASEVAFDRVRLTQGAQKKRQVKEILTPGGYKIPESLQIIPNDSEEVKAAKRRKIHAIKGQQKDEIKKKVATDKATSWQKFNKKASARSKTGFLTGKAKQSMFSVGDAPEARVGFMNSGQKMTEFQDRVKFTYNNF